VYHEGVPQEVICEVVGRSVNILDKPKSHTLHVQLLSTSRLCDLRPWRPNAHPPHRPHTQDTASLRQSACWSEVVGDGAKNRSTRWITIGSQP
jgi:hypothetical protein